VREIKLRIGLRVCHLQTNTTQERKNISPQVKWFYTIKCSKRPAILVPTEPAISSVDTAVMAIHPLAACYLCSINHFLLTSVALQSMPVNSQFIHCPLPASHPAD